MELEFALNTILLFLLIIFPGVVFQRFYYLGPFFKQFQIKSWFKIFTTSIFPGLVISYFTFVTVNNILPDPSYLEKIGAFFKRTSDSSKKVTEGIPRTGEIVEEIVESATFFDLETFTYLFLYFLILMFFSVISARICFELINKLELDHKFRIFRFQNYWFYYFKGKIVRGKEFMDLIPKGMKVVQTKAEVMVQIREDKNRVYHGLLKDYYTVPETGNLKEIILSDVLWYKPKPVEGAANGKKELKLERMKGHVLLIPYEKVMNINLQYIYTKEAQKSKWPLLLSSVTFFILVFFIIDYLGIYSGLRIHKALVIRLLMSLDWLCLTTFFYQLWDKKDFKGKNITLFVLFLFIVGITVLLFFLRA